MVELADGGVVGRGVNEAGPVVSTIGWMQGLPLFGGPLRFLELLLPAVLGMESDISNDKLGDFLVRLIHCGYSLSIFISSATESAC